MSDEYRLIDRSTEYETGWYDGGYDRVEQPDGSVKDYYWADLPNAVVVVAVTTDDELVFVEQYRPAARETFVGCPTGIVDDGESYEEAAVRELREETGYIAEEAELLTSMHVANGVLRHERGIVFADGLDRAGGQSLGDNEFLSVHTVPIDEGLAMMYDAPVSDGTLTALLVATDMDCLESG